jgi:uncharacterized protein
MKLHLAQNAGLLTFSSHGPGYVSVNGTRYEGSVLVCGYDIVTDWAPDGFEGLTASQFERLASMDAEIVLLAAASVSVSRARNCLSL